MAKMKNVDIWIAKVVKYLCQHRVKLLVKCFINHKLDSPSRAYSFPLQNPPLFQLKFILPNLLNQWWNVKITLKILRKNTKYLRSFGSPVGNLPSPCLLHPSAKQISEGPRKYHCFLLSLFKNPAYGRHQLSWPMRI